jgi:hypothetical protein
VIDGNFTRRLRPTFSDGYTQLLVDTASEQAGGMVLAPGNTSNTVTLNPSATAPQSLSLGGVRLSRGERISVGQLIQSRGTALVMQADGNLVLYRGYPHRPVPVWSSETASLPPGFRPTSATLKNGALVLEDPNGLPVWQYSTSEGDAPFATLVSGGLVLANVRNQSLVQVPLVAQALTQSVGPQTVGYNMTMATSATLYPVAFSCRRWISTTAIGLPRSEGKCLLSPLM